MSPRHHDDFSHAEERRSALVGCGRSRGNSGPQCIGLWSYDQIMAALSERYSEPVIELRRITVEQLDPVLQEETASWRSELDWDFHPSADLVRRFVHMQALSGFALMHGAHAVG